MLPPQQRIDEHWYKGTADAIYQNIYTHREGATREYVLILAGDHIYKMDYGEMIRAHRERSADLTIGCIPVPRREATQFGVMQVDDDDRVVGFLEKPQDPPSRCPATPTTALASMGIYVFTARRHVRAALPGRRPTPDSDHDFGKNIIPAMIEPHAGLRLPVPRREPQGRRRTGATSARSTPTTRPTWT